MAVGFSIRFLPRRAPLALVFSLLSLGLTICAWAAEPDWGAVEKEAGELLSRYLQIDTTNPPGNEIAAAAFWQQRLTQEGLEAQVFESQPGRGVVYARLKGSGEKKALVLRASDENRRRPGKAYHCREADPRRRGDYDFIAFIEQCRDNVGFGLLATG